MAAAPWLARVEEGASPKTPGAPLSRGRGEAPAGLGLQSFPCCLLGHRGRLPHPRAAVRERPPAGRYRTVPARTQREVQHLAVRSLSKAWVLRGQSLLLERPLTFHFSELLLGRKNVFKNMLVLNGGAEWQCRWLFYSHDEPFYAGFRKRLDVGHGWEERS